MALLKFCSHKLSCMHTSQFDTVALFSVLAGLTRLKNAFVIFANSLGRLVEMPSNGEGEKKDAKKVTHIGNLQVRQDLKVQIFQAHSLREPSSADTVLNLDWT